MTKKILFIAPYPYDEAPSQRFRFEQYLEYLNQKGFETEIVPFLDEKGWKTLYLEGGFLKKGMAMSRAFMRRWSLLFRLKRYQHIFVHREASMIGPPVFEWIIARVLKRRYIYDFDDAIWLPNYSESNARFHRLKMYWKIKWIIKWADKVTAGNDFLQDYALRFNRNVELIPTTIDTENVHSASGNPDNAIPVIGWTGSHTTGTYLPFLIPILDRLHQEHEFIFRIISNQDPDLGRPYVEFVKWSRTNEIDVLSSFNIGVMPLEDSIWAKGKCGFKALQYMALEIPAVVSPVGTNTDIIVNGENGLLCDSGEEWFLTLSELLADPTMRKRIGSNGRQTVVEHFSVLRYRDTYLQLFQ